MQQFLSNFIAGLAGKKAKEIYEKSQKENIGMIKLPGFFFWFGITEMIVCATLMVILFLFFLPQEGAWGGYRYFGIFVCYRTGSCGNSEKLSDCISGEGAHLSKFFPYNDSI